jgi:hypothetical protein
MQQLEIEYFFPLTEQIPLELNFKPCGLSEQVTLTVRTWVGTLDYHF